MNPLLRRLLICWRKAFESSEVREGRMFRTPVDVGDKTRGECQWRLFRVSGGETRRDRAVVVVLVAVVGAEGDDAPAPVVGPRCQLVSTPWYPDIGSNKPRGTNISYDRSGILSLVPPSSGFLVCLVPPFDPARAIKYNQDAMENHEKLSIGCFGITHLCFDKRFIDW